MCIGDIGRGHQFTLYREMLEFLIDYVEVEFHGPGNLKITHKLQIESKSQ